MNAISILLSIFLGWVKKYLKKLIVEVEIKPETNKWLINEPKQEKERGWKFETQPRKVDEIFSSKPQQEAFNQQMLRRKDKTETYLGV